MANVTQITIRMTPVATQHEIETILDVVRTCPDVALIDEREVDESEQVRGGIKAKGLEPPERIETLPVEPEPAPVAEAAAVEPASTGTGRGRGR